MANGPVRPVDERVLILAPTGRDATLCGRILAESGMAATTCADLPAVCRELAIGAGAAVLTEEALSRAEFGLLVEAVHGQPAWSDLPVLVLTRAGADSDAALEMLETLGNVTLLERPVRVPALVSAVRTALRARRRQYQIRDHLADAVQANDALREADRQKDEFLAMLAHELRNPLAPIRNAVHILKAHPPGTPAVADGRDIIDRQVTHLVRLVDDLLDVSRILRGKIALRPERLDLGTVLNRSVETARPLIDAQRHELTVRLSPTSMAVTGDLVRLAQVFANLLNNAAKYTEPGGHIRLTAAVEDGAAVVRVSDDGVGIAPDMIGRVFDVFTQAERSLDRSQGGLGLGLTLVRRLVDLHRGEVAAASGGLGRGSEFTVRLPLADPAERPGGAPSDHQEIIAVRRRVLVVDDNVDAADSLGHLLRMAGHDVCVAYDGTAALQSAAAQCPEVVILDIGLPGMSGYEVARRLRGLGNGRPARLVAVTGYGQESDRRRALDAGFDLHLTKPINPADLEAVLGLNGRSTGSPIS